VGSLAPRQSHPPASWGQQEIRGFHCRDVRKVGIIDAILTNTMLLDISKEFQHRILVGKTIERERVKAGTGVFSYEF
jgi:hypothetical protein